MKCNRNFRAAIRGTERRGVVIVEGAIVLSIMFFVLIAAMDLGLAVARYNVLASAARQTARSAVVRGQRSYPQLSSWGPTAVDCTAADANEIAAVVAAATPTMQPQDVRISMSWPDGENVENSRVQVDLTYRHTLISFLGFGPDLMLSAGSTMYVSR